MKMKLDLELVWYLAANDIWHLQTKETVFCQSLRIAFVNERRCAIYGNRQRSTIAAMTCTSVLAGKRKVLEYLRSKYTVFG